MVLTLSVLSLSACSTGTVTQDTTSTAPLSPQNQQPNGEVNTDINEPPETAVSTELNEELGGKLLENLLIANIASRRGKYEAAASALMSASYSSRNSRIIADAIQFSSLSGNYVQIIELSNLLKEVTPENPGVLLSVASAHFQLGNHEKAVDALAELIGGTNQQSISQNTLLNSARLLVQQKNDDVTQLFFQLAEHSNEDANLNFVAAIVASNTKEHMDKVTMFIDQVLKISSHWEQAAIIKFNSLLLSDQAKAQAFAENFLVASPSANQLRLALSRQLLQNHQLDLASKELQIILKQDPDSAEALFTSGLIYIETDELDRAKVAFKRLLEGFPQHNQSKIYLAEIANREEKYLEAIVYLQQVDGQQYIDAQISLSRALVKLKGVDAGIEHLQKTGARTEEDKIKLILEQDSILRAGKLLDRLKRFLDDSLKQFPNQPDLLYNRGLLAAELNLLDLHERDLKRLIDLQPDNAHAYNALGYTLADKTGRLEEAMALIRKANTLLPDNPFILDSLGWVFFRQGNNEEAIKYLRQAIAINSDPEIAAHLGEVLWVTGDRKEAEKVWMEAKKANKDNPVLRETIERLATEQQS